MVGKRKGPNLCYLNVLSLLHYPFMLAATILVVRHCDAWHASAASRKGSLLSGQSERFPCWLCCVSFILWSSLRGGGRYRGFAFS
jgi:hypothetical protein